MIAATPAVKFLLAVSDRSVGLAKRFPACRVVGSDLGTPDDVPERAPDDVRPVDHVVHVCGPLSQ